jgi:hypothetical protein
MGVGFSGMLRFEEGLPHPIVPKKYPRGHTVDTLEEGEAFITVVYGERLEMSTGGEFVLSLLYGSYM